ncbi:lmo0954 family membrane protein [Sporosarcina sp. CAU 1771]
MNKFLLVLAGTIAAIIVLLNLGSLLALAFSTLIAYAGFHYYRKSNSSLAKVFWGLVILIGILTAISNIPAFIGIIALVAVYYVLRNWKQNKNDAIISVSDDPFNNFERQWNELIK